MGLLETVKDEQQRQELTRVPAAGLVHGVVSMVEQDYRWMRPLRFVEEQMRALGSVQAWHPGLYRQMARTSAGICVEFDTDAREVALEVRLDAEPRGTREVLAVVDRAQGTLPRPHDGVSADVDGRHLPCVMPADGVELVSFSLVSGDPEEALGLIALPGLARTRRVRIWLPCLRGCVIRDVYCDGTFIRPVAHRKVLLALGDSITQGFVADDPAFAWPSLLAQRLGLDVVNQGVGGQVFQPGSLLGLAGVVDVARIVVAFGENYRYEPCIARRVSRDVRSYLLEVARLWPQVPTCVLTPFWHDEEAWPSRSNSCFDQVPSFITAHTASHDQMVVIDGLDLLDHDSALMADGYEHPGERGMRQIATRLNAVIRVPGLRASSVGRRRPRKRKALPEVTGDGLPNGMLPLPLDELL